MESSTSDDQSEDGDLFYIECLKEELEHDLLQPFRNVEERIDVCVRKWKLKLKVEKQKIRKMLKWDDMLGRIHHTQTPKREKTETGLSYEDIDKIQQRVKIMVTKEFENVLQYKGGILCCEGGADICSVLDTCHKEGANASNGRSSKSQSGESDASFETNESDKPGRVGYIQTLAKEHSRTDQNIAERIVNAEECRSTNKDYDSEENMQQSLFISSDEVHDSDELQVSSAQQCFRQNKCELTNAKECSSSRKGFDKRFEQRYTPLLSRRIAITDHHMERSVTDLGTKNGHRTKEVETAHNTQGENVINVPKPQIGFAEQTSSGHSAHIEGLRKGTLVKTGPDIGQINDKLEGNNKVPNSMRKSMKKIDVSDIQKHIRESGTARLMGREERILPFRELRNQLASPIPTVMGQGNQITKPNGISTKLPTLGNEDSSIICRKYSTTDRNWIDILLFPDYYLVTIQKKQSDFGTYEWLNKYSKETGETTDWLHLPEAGRMSTINGKGGIVAVLQIGRKFRCIAVVRTSGNSTDIQANKLETLYRVSIMEAYFGIACFENPHLKFGTEPNAQLKFAAVFSSTSDGLTVEQIDTFYPQILSMRRDKTRIRIYDSVKTVVLRNSGIGCVSTVSFDKILTARANCVACADIRGNTLWEVSTKSRVTDIASQGNIIFACLQDVGKMLKITIKKNNEVVTEDNVLRNEGLQPSQVSVCGREMLIREFILAQYRSEIVIRVIRL